MQRIFTLEIGGKPIVAFEAKNLHEALQLRGEQWFRDDVAHLKAGGIPLWDGKTVLQKPRRALKSEEATFFEATREARSPSDEMVLVYLLKLDASIVEAS